MHVTFTSPILSYPPVGGPELRIANSLKALRQVSDVEVVPQQPLGEATQRFLTDLEIPIRDLPLPGVRARLLPTGSRADTALLARHLARQAKTSRSCAIWFGYGNISYPLMSAVRRSDPSQRLICDTDSVWSRFVRREVAVTTDRERRHQVEQQAQAKEQEEQSWVEMCDATTAVSEVDADYYRSLASDPSRIHVFSNGIDTADYDEPPPPPSDFRPPGLFLGGSFYAATSPMAHATQWVLDEVMPLLRQGESSPHLYIVGRGSDRIFGDVQAHDVTVLGEVASVLPFLANSVASLVPLFFESGTRFKILEAGALAVPVVSTTLGAEGIPVRDGTDAIIADEPERFAAAIREVCTDPSKRRSLGRNLQRLVSEHYSIDALADQAESILATVCEERL